MDEAQQVERTPEEAIRQQWEALPDSEKLALMHEGLMQIAERGGTVAAEVVRLRAEVDELRERNLEGLRQRIELAEGILAYKGALEAQKCVIWACLSASPEARAYMERERPNFREALRRMGVDESQLTDAVAMLEGSLQWVANERPKTLSGWIGRLWFDLCAAVQVVASPSRWTRWGVIGAAVVVGCAALLAFG